MNLKKTFITIGNVLKRPAYALLTILTALLIIAISTYLLNIPLLASTITAPWAWTAKIMLLGKLLGGAITNNSPFTFLLLLLTSFLAGINMALALYQWKHHRALTMTKNSTTTTGIGVGILAAGCSGCGLSILAILGLAGVIAFLPFKGQELSVFSIIILTTTLFWLAKNPTKVCVIRDKKVEETKQNL